jgi:hypothetical protein
MKACLIDTNVLLAASAFEPSSTMAKDAMPLEIELREQVFKRLMDFEKSDDRLVLDIEGSIWEEYERNLPRYTSKGQQEYAWMVILHKQTTSAVSHVTIDIHDGNGERVALVNPPLDNLVADREDRKWVAAALSHMEIHNQDAVIVYGAETDWFKIEDQLKENGINLERVLPHDWYQRHLK